MSFIFLFLFTIQEGRLYILNNQIAVISNHKVIKEKITEDVKIIKRITDDYCYYPKVTGWLNKDYFKILKKDMETRIMSTKLYYINYKLVIIEIREIER